MHNLWVHFVSLSNYYIIEKTNWKKSIAGKLHSVEKRVICLCKLFLLYSLCFLVWNKVIANFYGCFVFACVCPSSRYCTPNWRFQFLTVCFQIEIKKIFFFQLYRFCFHYRNHVTQSHKLQVSIIFLFKHFSRLVMRCDWLLRPLISLKKSEMHIKNSSWVSCCCHVYVVLLLGRLFDVKLRRDWPFSVFACIILSFLRLEQCALVKLFKIFASLYSYFAGLWLSLIINRPNWLPELLQLIASLFVEILTLLLFLKIIVFKNLFFVFGNLSFF